MFVIVHSDGLRWLNNQVWTRDKSKATQYETAEKAFSALYAAKASIGVDATKLARLEFTPTETVSPIKKTGFNRLCRDFIDLFGNEEGHKILSQIKPFFHTARVAIIAIDQNNPTINDIEALLECDNVFEMLKMICTMAEET